MPKSGFEQRRDWVLDVMKPIAIKDHYQVKWPDSAVCSLDRGGDNSWERTMDVAGFDKWLVFPGGHGLLLGQRFRKARYASFYDFTLSNREFTKHRDAVAMFGSIPDQYAYGVANPTDDGFMWFKIFRYRPFFEWALSRPLPTPHITSYNQAAFYTWPFAAMPKDWFTYEYL